MADYRNTQPTWTGGEISQELYGRKDLARYQTSVKKMENMIIHAAGGASNRNGLKFVGEAPAGSFNKINTFEAAGDDAFLLVWGNNNLRFVANGGYVVDGGSPYEVATVYGSGQLSEIYMDQSSDIATITHPDFAVNELRRYGTIDWRFNYVNWSPTVAPPTGVSVATTAEFEPEDGSALPVTYQYRVSSVSKEGKESLPSDIVTSGPLVFGYSKNFNVISWSAAAGDIEEYIVYKGKNGVFGSIGRTPNLEFKDDNIAPDFTNGPQDGYNPFDNGNYPAINFFAEQRRGFARSDQFPQTIWMTQSADFASMRTHTPTQDADALEFTLAATKKQDIFHVLAKERGLLVFTRSGEWTVKGRDGDILTPSSILPNPQSYYGAAQSIRPMILGNSILFVQRDRKTVLEMEYSFEVDSYKADDKTLLAKHLFEGRSIVDWDYAKRPHDVIWVVMSDGSLLSLTYMKDQDVWGWSRHWTVGNFVDVSVVPEIDGDIPYFLVERINSTGLKRFIEYMPPRDFEDIRDVRFLDSNVSYDNPLSYSGIVEGNNSAIKYSGPGWASGDEIEISGSIIKDIDGVKVGSYDGRYHIAPSSSGDWFLIHATASEEWDKGDPLDTSYIQSWSRPVVIRKLGVVRRCIGRITSGLQHLEGCKVIALCDGYVYDKTFGGEDLIVSGGGLPAFDDFSDAKFARIHVGLPYSSTLQTLDFVNTQADDNGVPKVIGSVYARILRTRGLKFAIDDGELFEAIPAREDEGYYEPSRLLSSLFELAGTSGWDRDHSITFVQDYPLPMTILGLTNDYTYGDP